MLGAGAEETGCGGRASSSAVSSFTLAAAVPPRLVFLPVSGTDFLLPPRAWLLAAGGQPHFLLLSCLPSPPPGRPPPAAAADSPPSPRAPPPPPTPSPRRLPRCRLRGCPARRAGAPPSAPGPAPGRRVRLEPERGLVCGHEQVRRTGAPGPGPGDTLFCKVESRGREGFPPPRRTGAPLRRAARRGARRGGDARPRGSWAPFSPRVPGTGRGGREPLRPRLRGP